MNDINLLLNKVRNGDSSAGPIVVSLYGRRLIRYINLIAPSLSEVDRELLAERIIEAALGNIERFDPQQGSFDTWVRGYARRKLLEHYRTHPDNVGTEELELAEQVDAGDPARPENSALLDAVMRALASLPATDQLIISLRDINGLTYQQIADELSVSAQACRQRHRRAVLALRQAVEGQGDLPTAHEPRPDQVSEESRS